MVDDKGQVLDELLLLHGLDLGQISVHGGIELLAEADGIVPSHVVDLFHSRFYLVIIFKKKLN